MLYMYHVTIRHNLNVLYNIMHAKVGTCQALVKFCPKYYKEFPKILPIIILFQCPIMLPMQVNNNTFKSNILISKCSIRAFHYKMTSIRDSGAMRNALSVLLQCALTTDCSNREH